MSQGRNTLGRHGSTDSFSAPYFLPKIEKVAALQQPDTVARRRELTSSNTNGPAMPDVLSEDVPMIDDPVSSLCAFAAVQALLRFMLSQPFSPIIRAAIWFVKRVPGGPANVFKNVKQQCAEFGLAAPKSEASAARWRITSSTTLSSSTTRAAQHSSLPRTCSTQRRSSAWA
eukprot:scaffold85178_cov67-Phaeocystis_antarctica.AAC.2